MQVQCTTKTRHQAMESSRAGDMELMRSGGGRGENGVGGLYRERDSQVKGAARPIRWLQLITVWLLIVRRPQADLLRRGGEFDLVAAPPPGDLCHVEGEEREQKVARRTPAGCAVAFFSSSFHGETVPPSVLRSPLTTSHRHNPPDGTRYTVQSKRRGCARRPLCARVRRHPSEQGGGADSRGRRIPEVPSAHCGCVCVFREKLLPKDCSG